MRVFYDVAPRLFALAVLIGLVVLVKKALTPSATTIEQFIIAAEVSILALVIVAFALDHVRPLAELLDHLRLTGGHGPGGAPRNRRAAEPTASPAMQAAGLFFLAASGSICLLYVQRAAMNPAAGLPAPDSTDGQPR